MRMYRGLGSGRPAAVVDTQEVFRRRQGRNGSDFGHLRSAVWCPTERPKREQPCLTGDFGAQRWPPVVSDSVWVPAIFTRSSPRLVQGWKTLDPPVQRAFRK